MPRSFILLAFAFLPTSISLPAADNWLKLRTGNFELYTNAGERSGKNIILYFEQVRSFFAQTMQLPSGGKPVRIVLFRSEKDFAPYRPNEGTAGYYLPLPEGDTIALQKMDSYSYPAVIHEYVHLLVKHGPGATQVPTWLNEGMADLFSTLEPVGRKVRVGQFIGGRLASLQGARWLDLQTLFTVDHRSPHYNEKDKAGVFYGQSWLLTHMLVLSDDYRPKWPEFQAAVKPGEDPAPLFQRLYGRNLKTVLDDLRLYARSERIKVLMYDVKLEKSAESPIVEEAAELDSGLTLASLLTGINEKEARERCQALRDRFPDRPEAHAALGYLDWRKGDAAAALPHFTAAVEGGSRNTQLLLDYAKALQITRQPKEKILPALEKAVEIAPEDVDLRVQMAATLSQMDRNAEALKQLAQVKRVHPDRALLFFRLLAYAAYRNDQTVEARAAAKRAKSFAREPEDHQWLDEFLERLDAGPPLLAATIRSGTATGPAEATEEPPRTERRDAPRPPEPAATDTPTTPELPQFEGSFTHLECAGQMARMHVTKGGRAVVFTIEDPTRIVIRGQDTGTLDLACGPQKPRPVSVEYEPKDGLSGRSVGVVRGIEFQGSK